MAGTTIGSALLGQTALLVVAAAVVLGRGRTHRTQGEALETRVTGTVLGLVVLSVISAAFGFGSIFHLTVVMNVGV